MCFPFSMGHSHVVIFSSSMVRTRVTYLSFHMDHSQIAVLSFSTSILQLTYFSLAAGASDPAVDLCDFFGGAPYCHAAGGSFWPSPRSSRRVIPVAPNDPTFSARPRAL